MGILGIPSLSRGDPIPKLFGTGFDATGKLLPIGQSDPNYELIESPDPALPGPKLFAVDPSAAGNPWLKEGNESRWIAPTSNLPAGHPAGVYIFRTRFDLAALDPGQAVIRGKWAVDNGGADIELNGISLGLWNADGFSAWTEFTIDSGFVDGVNELDFILFNAPGEQSPVGLRVEMTGTSEPPGNAPSIFRPPESQTVVAGQNVILSVLAEGTGPLTFQWQQNQIEVPGATRSTLAISSVSSKHEGQYTVTVRNASGSITTPPVQLTVLEPIPGFYGTGVDDLGRALRDGAVDPHYQIAVNPDGNSRQAVVHDSTIFPLVEGPWVANSNSSKWIAPRLDTSAAAGGDYVYRLVFNLAGLDSRTAFIAGSWATDNVGLDILLNGTSTKTTNHSQFVGLNPFLITNSFFLPETNSLDFKINNSTRGFTGLRVENLRAGARKIAGTPPMVAPKIIQGPRSTPGFLNESVTLRVQAEGTSPLEYQWLFNSQPISRANQAALLLTNLSFRHEGTYAVRVANPGGSTTSAPAQLAIVEEVPGLFDTGVDPDGDLLQDLEMDPHYQLIVSPEAGVQRTFVHDSSLFPLLAGPWIANSDASKWISPRPESSRAPSGAYLYRTTFDLSGFDPGTAFLTGKWASDNQGLDILLNGKSAGAQTNNHFLNLTSFSVSGGFLRGTNTLDFSLLNKTPGYTGLRIEDLRAGAKRIPAVIDAPKLSAARNADGTLTLSWPAASTGFRLESSETLASTDWSSARLPQTTSNESHQVVLRPAGQQRFYRLRRDAGL